MRRPRQIGFVRRHGVIQPVETASIVPRRRPEAATHPLPPHFKQAYFQVVKKPHEEQRRCVDFISRTMEKRLLGLRRTLKTTFRS
ncbi:hypothetical protein D3C72_2125110 [compost metagenome]